MTAPGADPQPATVPGPDVPAPDGPAPAGPGATAAGPVAGPALPEQSREDTDAAWGDYPERDDDRLDRDRPPHWDDF